MHYTVYRITNTINGRQYIGSHKTANLDDGYYGSGKYIKLAIAKYGIANFVKEVLFDFDNRQDMLAKEKELVNEDWIKKSYNATVGGGGGGCVALLEPNHPNRTLVLNKISASNTGKVRTQAMKDHQRVLRTGCINEKNSERLSQQWIITKPDGTELLVDRLAKYCKENSLDKSSMQKVAYGERLHHKEHKCRKYNAT